MRAPRTRFFKPTPLPAGPIFLSLVFFPSAKDLSPPSRAENQRKTTSPRRPSSPARPTSSRSPLRDGRRWEAEDRAAGAGDGRGRRLSATDLPLAPAGFSSTGSPTSSPSKAGRAEAVRGGGSRGSGARRRATGGGPRGGGARPRRPAQRSSSPAAARAEATQGGPRRFVQRRCAARAEAEQAARLKAEHGGARPRGPCEAGAGEVDRLRWRWSLPTQIPSSQGRRALPSVLRWWPLPSSSPPVPSLCSPSCGLDLYCLPAAGTRGGWGESAGPPLMADAFFFSASRSGVEAIRFGCGRHTGSRCRLFIRYQRRKNVTMAGSG
ncbi:unnamed protein product [Urochloa humidicola]